MKRLALLLAVVAAVAAAGTARADAPTHQFLPPAEDFVFPGCGFAVEVDFVMDKVHELTWTGPDGAFRAKLNGVVRIALTNPAIDKTVTVNVSGPLMYEEWPDGSFVQYGSGPWLWYGNPMTLGPEGLYFINGRFSWSGTGGEVTFEHAGPPLVDLCPELEA